MSSVIVSKKLILSKPLLEKALKPSRMVISLLLSSLFWSASAQSNEKIDETNESSALEQQQYQIQDFSDDYYAIIKPKAYENEDSESNSVIEVIDVKTKKVLISQSADIEIEYELDNSKELKLGEKISANIVSIPYGESSVLIYDDFNFDNQKDLALKDGRYGCYGGPSYQVYLKDGDAFVHSDSFTELAQGYCGFFGIDKDTQTLHTMTKSGAAWHENSVFKVIDNKPMVVHILETQFTSNDLVSITESTRVNGKMHVDNYKMLPPYDEQDDKSMFPFIYRFDIENGKKMVLSSTYKNGAEQMYYAFADKNDKVELYYDGKFAYDPSRKTLSFTNKPVVYQINNQGITVKLPNKTVLLKSQPTSAQGSLDKVAQFKNVRVK